MFQAPIRVFDCGLELACLKILQSVCLQVNFGQNKTMLLSAALAAPNEK